MTEQKLKKGMPKLAKIVILILIMLLVIGVIGSLFAGTIIKKLISGAISQKTGIQSNLNGIDEGKLEFTDPKTGVKLNIGGNSIPGDFPKDFPIYPNSKVTTSLSGDQHEKNGGFWLTLTTPDSASEVSKYYKENLKKNGWTYQNASEAMEGGENLAVSKGKLSGYLAIDRPKDEDQTSILIVLGETTSAPTNQ